MTQNTTPAAPAATTFCWATELALVREPITLTLKEAREISDEMQRMHAKLAALTAAHSVEQQGAYAELHALRQINAEQAKLLELGIPGSALRASSAQAPAAGAGAGPTDAQIIAAYRAYNGWPTAVLERGDEAARWKQALTAALAATQSDTERDAARWRWIKNNDGDYSHPAIQKMWADLPHDMRYPTPEMWDAAIDAARAAKAQPAPAAGAVAVQDLQPVHDAVTIELLNERVAYLEGKLQQAAPTPAAQQGDALDAQRWRTFTELPHEIRAEWARNLSLVPVLTQWIDQASIDAAIAAKGG